MLINGIKFACNTCVKGHRSSTCNHSERPLVEIRKKGRPVTQCSYCRDLRKTKQVHVKCTCSKTTKQQQKRQCYQCPPSIQNPTQTTENWTMIEEYVFPEPTVPEIIPAIPELDTTELNLLLTTALEPMMVPPICGSFTPHTTCSSNGQGQSVVITITPLSKNANTTSRIVTCYCGDSCICPGCFVHPNNYDTLLSLPMSISSSSCSSDDEEKYTL